MNINSRFTLIRKTSPSLRLDTFTDKALPQRGPGVNGDGNFQLVELKLIAKPLDPKAKDAPQEIKLKPVFAAAEDKDQPLAHAVDGKPNTAWVVKTTAKKDNAAVFELEQPLAGFAGGTELYSICIFARWALAVCEWQSARNRIRQLGPAMLRRNIYKRYAPSRYEWQ